jgi:hypothetical protein
MGSGDERDDLGRDWVHDGAGSGRAPVPCRTGTLAVEHALLTGTRLAAALASGEYCCAFHALLDIGVDAG